jgi:HAE1 family hydrophobic/amphiphilic exporter-1
VSIGSSGSALRDAFSGGGSGITYSITTDPAADQVALREDVQEAVAALDDAGTITIAAAGGGFGSSDIEIDVTAPDSGTLQEATDAVIAAVDGEDGVGQVTSNLSASLPYIAVTVDRDAAAALGLSEVAVGALVSSTMQPQSIGSVEIDDTALTVYLAASQTPATLAELRLLTVPTALGPIPLEQVATVEQSEGPTSITTQQGQRTSTVTVTPSTDDLAAATATVTTALEDAELPNAADASLGGVVSQQQDAFTQLGLAMLAAILIVYIVMVATFKSLRQPLLLLVSVPFAATGAILLQIITGVPLGVASLIGVLMLIGIVVTNAIVLVDLVNQYRVKGLSAHDATVAGGSRRLRPILMTALATIFALTPMALGITGQGGFISQPLAIVVIGGLVSSTVLTLLVLPTLYNLVEGARERRQARRDGDGGGDGGGSPRPGDGSGPGAADASATPASGAAGFETRRQRRAREAAAAAPAAVMTAVEVPMIEEAPDVEVPVGDGEGEPDEAADTATQADVPMIEEAPDIEVPTDALRADASTEPESEPQLEREPETEAESEPENDAESEPENDAEGETGDDPEAARD